MDAEELMAQQPGGADKAKQESPLLSLEKDLQLYSGSIREVAIEIMMEGISSYPIFVAHQHVAKIGEMILNKDELNTNWTIQASTLEEFVEKGVIHPDKKAHFLKSYKKPEDFICLFVIVAEGANFVYYPYKK